MTLRTSVNVGIAPLRLVFRPRTRTAPPSEAPAVERTAPDVEFVAYALDCTLSGRLELAADRVTDLLNEHEDLELVDVRVEDLVGGEGHDIATLGITRDEILAVHATGPRGRADKRRRTRQHPIMTTLGPYRVRGYVHALPGVEPIASLRHREPMVPVTDAVIEYSVGRQQIRRRVSTLLINRTFAHDIVAGIDGTDPLDRVATPDG